MKKILLIASIAWFAAVGTPTLAPIAGVGTVQARQLPDFADLAEKAGPAVVNIRTTERVKEGAAPPQRPQMPEGMEEGDPFFEFFRRFFPPNQRPQPRGRGPGDEVPRGVGSGFVISADGYLLTNHHVVEGADEIYVTFTDKRELKGRLVGSDRRTDVALVKVEATGLPHLPIGNPTRLRVGEWVMAIGSPFGLDNTVTAGIVSAKGRDTGDYLPFIQTDVAVNPGNSGGPLLNLAGEVVGINSQIYSRTGGFMGISFAIPIDEAMRVADQLRDSGRVTRGRIGVGIAEVTKDVAEALSLQRASGALVRSVEAGSPAERGGVEVGDIITRFDGRPIERSSDLPRLVGGTRPGTQVSVQVWRKGSTRDLNLTVAELEPDRSARASGRGAPGDSQERGATNLLGVTVSDISDDRRQQLRIRQGVLVDAADGAGARAGIRAGDVILALNNQDIGSAKQFNEIVAKLDRSRTHVLLIRRGDSAQYVPVRPAAR